MMFQFSLQGSLRSIALIGLLAMGRCMFSGASLHAKDSNANQSDAITVTADSFRSGPARVRLLRFESSTVGTKPVVVMLHGCDGWEQMAAYRFAAKALAQEGYVVILIRYFDRTNTPDQETPAQRAEFIRWLEGKAAGEKDHAARAHFADWVATVGDAIAYARQLPNVDPSRVGVVGFSLGGYVAVAAAAEPQFRVNAVVEMMGGLAEEYRSKVKTLPPALIVHGEEDRIVPVKEAYALHGLLLNQKRNVDVEIYPGVGHGFLLPGKDTPNMLVVMEAKKRMTGFFRKQLLTETTTVAARK